MPWYNLSWAGWVMVVWYNLSWAGWVMEGIDINWDVSPVSSPVIGLSHRSEFNKEETRGARQHDAHPNF